MNKRVGACAAVVALAVSTIAAARGAVPSAATDVGARNSSAPPPLVWQDCGDGFQCATLKVPLDYKKLNATQIDIALIRRPAENPGIRIGSLITNPGGPGAPGIEDLRRTAAGYPPDVRARFDLVSFDPRGVGVSTKVDCLDPAELHSFFGLDASPDSPEKRDALVAGLQHFADACQQRSGALLPFVSTPNAARDMDRIRGALGETKLSYVGYSYGTYLGALYAQLFPKRVRALVLDGAVAPPLAGGAHVLEQAVGYEHALQAFLADCAARRDCPFWSGGDPAGAFDQLMARIERDGIPAPALGNRRLGPAEVQASVPAMLTGGEPVWPALSLLLSQASRGDASGLLSVADGFERAIDIQANIAIVCSDVPTASNERLQGVPALVERARQAAPHFTASVNGGATGCAVWPIHSRSVPTLRAKGAPPIVVIGTRGDPATPFPWAEALTRQLKSGVLLSAPGFSHTSFAMARQSSEQLPIPAKTCVDDLVVRYLVDLQAPANGTVCE
jgi:pimeloyl-ACP methyl ester carboxylesterase